MSLDRTPAVNPYDYLPPVPRFALASTDISEGETVPLVHTHSMVGGGNESPALSWAGFPSETRSFAVTCFDPDAPTPSGFWHWVVVDLPATSTSLARGAGESDVTLPGGFHASSDFCTPNYGGCAPPAGDGPHRYYFVVHALDVESLGVDASASPAMVSFNLVFHTLARAILVSTFEL